ncbi:MAG: glycosyltransferase family 2 protein [Clostridia bacterium]|nr:glycosyltransferase family 2 protein [Clostridia bacterium]
MKIAGVVVLYNPDSRVQDNIKTYLDGVDVLFAVDNSSCNNKDLFCDEKIVYIANMENKGIAAALNIAAKRAIKKGYLWLLTMDQDSRFDVGGVEKMTAYLESRKDNNKIGLITPYHKTGENNPSSAAVDSPLVCMTSGNIINLLAFEKIGGFKEWLFIDSVDFEYCLNLRENGFDILRLNSVLLNHSLGTKSEKGIGKLKRQITEHSAARRYYITRNRLYINDMYRGVYPDFCKAENKSTKKEVLKIILFEKEKKAKLSAMLKGYKDYKKGIKGKMQ